MPQQKRTAVAVYCKFCDKYIPCTYVDNRNVKYVCPHNDQEKTYLANLCKINVVKWGETGQKNGQPEDDDDDNDDDDTEVEEEEERDEEEDEDEDCDPDIDIRKFQNEWKGLNDRYSELVKECKDIKKRKVELVRNLVRPVENFTGCSIKVNPKKDFFDLSK